LLLIQILFANFPITSPLFFIFIFQIFGSFLEFLRISAKFCTCEDLNVQDEENSPIKARSIWSEIQPKGNSRDFSHAILSSWKMPKLLNFTFPEGDIFLNFDNTELKRSAKIIFSISERHRRAVVV